jgi:hypothetical protein
MKMLRHLSSEEADALNTILLGLSERAKRTLTLNQLLQQWGDFVVQVERGYQDSIYEYANDLSIRDLLEEILRGVTQTLQEKLTQLIQPWDERFYNATKKTKQPVLPSMAQESLRSWWFRVPKNLGGELKEDLRSEGILK